MSDDYTCIECGAWFEQREWCPACSGTSIKRRKPNRPPNLHGRHADVRDATTQADADRAQAVYENIKEQSE